MSKKILVAFFVAASMILFLSGCGPQYRTVYSYVPPHSWRGRQCINQCLAQKENCQNLCNSQAQTCRTEANLEALPAYLNYDHEQRKAGQPDYESVNDFSDTSSCNTHCGCSANYRSCFANCGGSVYASQQCTAFCPATAAP